MTKLDHPYADLSSPGHWLRGNLHAHSTKSDGAVSPQEVIDDYARRGYDFLMLSDHDICTTPQECGVWDAKGMVLLPGNEVSAAGPHLLHVGGQRRVEPVAERQAVLDAIAAEAAERDGEAGFAVMNHPNWQGAFDHWPIGRLRELRGYAGIEIFNGVIGRLDGSPYATNKWDMLLSDGRRVWGFANDDSHRPDGDVGLGWNMVYARERTAAAILDAMRGGRFYASTGVTITSIRVEGLKVRVETRDARRIVALMNVGKRFAQADGRSIEAMVPENARYVRFECWGEGERFAWTQPFFVG